MARFYSQFESNMGIDPNVYAVWSYPENENFKLTDFGIISFYLYD